MSTTKSEVEYQGRRFELVPDNPEVGVYLYVYENGKNIADYLQDSVELCIEHAEDLFGVPKDLWL